MNLNTKGKMLRILQSSLNLKDMGIDVFFYYSPHVNLMTLQIYDGEWDAEEPSEYIKVYTNDIRGLENIHKRLLELESEAKKKGEHNG